MRELKDYFCTVIQTNALIKLGYVQKDHIGYIKHDGEVYCRPVFFADSKSAILRSQALDFFRDKKILGEVRAIWDSYTYVIWMEDVMSPLKTGFNQYPTYHEAESALIDKLIELLESEAQHGKDTE